MPRRSFRRLLLAIMAATFAMFAGAVSPASADQGDKQGWSLGSDPRKRVFLRFVPANDGPRVLVLGCLRDVDSFIVLSEQDIRHWTWPSRHAHANQRRGPLCRRGQVRGGWRWRRTAWLCQRNRRRREGTAADSPKAYSCTGRQGSHGALGWLDFARVAGGRTG